MEYNKYKSLVKELLSLAEIEINGSNHWDIQVHDEKFYKRAITDLLSSTSAFRARSKNQLWQIVLSKNGVLVGYNSVR